jgi:hypothetical protein
MGFKQVRTSDLSGVDLADDQVVTVVVKTHPDALESKIFDASVDELSGLKAMTNLVELELRAPSGVTSSIVVSKTDFAKLVTDEKLEKLDSARGRRTGFRPNGNG